MNKEANRPRLIFEEKKAVKLLLWLFYFFYIMYELLMYVVLPKFTDYGIENFPGTGLGWWLYVLLFCMLPISLYLIKKGNPYPVKYFIFISFIFIDIIDNLLTYFGTYKEFASGNVVEILFVFFSPVFVNKRYFRTVFLLLIGKYAFLGLVLRDPIVLPPIILILVFSAIAFILLIRFNSYIISLTNVHEELRQKERLAVIGQMATAIGHEIRNPISSLKGFIQLQKEQYPDTNDFYPIMIQEVDRINSIVNDLMYIGKPRAIQYEKADIKEIIEYVISMTKPQLESLKISIETTIEDCLPSIECDERQLKQVFINLLKNAIEAILEEGRIQVSVILLNETTLQILMRDNGCGIKDEDIPNIGVPFFTTKKEGTGLGLMVTNQIIRDHNGDIEIDSVIGEGTTVAITLPITQKNNSTFSQN